MTFGRFKIEDKSVQVRMSSGALGDQAQAEVNTILRLCREAVAPYLQQLKSNIQLLPPAQPVFVEASFAISYDVAAA